MHSSPKKTFDDWADSIDHNEKRILAALSPLIDHLIGSFHSRGKAHGNICPDVIAVVGEDQIDIHGFAAAQGVDCESPYASPDADENGQLQPSFVGDVYSLSAVCYRALSGQTPIKASNRKRRANEDLPLSEAVNSSLRAAVRAGLSIDPKDRPQSLIELRNLFEGALVSNATQPGEAEEVPDAPQPTEALASTTKTESHPLPQERAVPPPPPTSPKVPNPVKRLPTNLTAGQTCRVPLANVIPDLGEWKLALQASEALGAAFDEEAGELVFKPTKAGEHVLTLELSQDYPDHPALPKPIAVTVNPDPDSLWQNKLSDPSLPYYKVDTDSKEVVTPVARIIAASQRGRSHAHEGSCRDDDFLFRYDEATGWHLLAAADGAGSAKFSRQGSLIACTEAIAHMGNWLGKETANLSSAVEQYLSSTEPDQKHLRNCAYAWLGGAAFEARKAINAEAEKRDPPATLRDFHTTLLLAVAKVTPSGWLLLTFSVGDGGIAAVSADGQPVSLCTPDSGDFSGQTVFLTGPGVLRSGEDVANRIHIQLLQDFSALFLLTDGITDPKFPTDASFVDKDTWSAFLDELAEKVNFGEAGDGAEARLLSWLSFRSPGNHDDRTIVALLNTPPSPETANENEEGSSTGFFSWFRSGRKKKQVTPST